MSWVVGAGESPAGGLRIVELQDNGGGGPVLDPAFLFSADFIRQGDDLLLRGADGQEVFIEGYFSQSPPPPLETPEGARLTGETVEALAQTSVAQSYAQAGGFTLGQPIGEVTLLNGTARVQRADGTRENLSQGDPIFQGDVVATGVGSDLGILFIDETVFSLSANSRMLINELLYNPSSTVNSMGVSLIQGTFVFITGQVAPTGGMEVETPVGTIGIRGTTVGTQIATFGGRTTIANLEHPETGEIGSFTFSNGAGEAIFSEGNHFLQVTSANQPPGTPSVISGTQIAQTFGRALNTAVQVQRNASQQQDPGEEQEGSLQGEPLQALQQAGLTPEQIEQILNVPVIETAAGPESGSQGSSTPSSGSGVGGSLQTEAVQNANTPVGAGLGSGIGQSIQGTLPPTSVTPPAPVGIGGEATLPPLPSLQPPPPPPPGNAAPVATDDSITVSEDGVSGSSGATPAQVEAFLGLAGGALNALADDGNAGNGLEVATSGTAMKTQVTVQAGDEINFFYNFLDSEGLNGAATFQDFGFVVINGEAIRLSNVGDANTPSGASFSLGSYSVLFDEESGYLTFQGVFDVSGTVQIGFGAMNEGDQILDAGLLIDSLVITRSGEQVVFQDGFSSLTNWQTLGGNFVTTVGDIGTNQPLPGAPSQALLISASVTTVQSNVLADNGNGPDSDPDGDPLTVTAVNGSAAGVGTQITLPSGALLTLSANGNFSYDPNGQFGDLGQGESAEDSFNYTISDGSGGSGSATVTVTILGSDDEGGGNFFGSALVPADLADGLGDDLDSLVGFSTGGLPQSDPGIEASGSSFPLVPQSDPLTDIGLEQAIPVA
jgi:hypothetical protein